MVRAAACVASSAPVSTLNKGAGMAAGAARSLYQETPVSASHGRKTPKEAGKKCPCDRGLRLPA